MSRDPNAEPPRWGKWGLLALFFVVLVAAFNLSARAASGNTIQLGCTDAQIPPLNHSYVWARTDACDPGVHGLLALISEAHQAHSFQWPLYAQCSPTDSSDATFSSSQNTCIQARVLQGGTGAPWTAGFHSETFVGKDVTGAIQPTRATVMNYDAELTRYSPFGWVAAYEANSVGVNGPWPDVAYNVDGPYHRGLAFRSSSQGDTAIDVQGQWGTGLDLHGLSLHAGHIDATSLTVNGRAVSASSIPPSQPAPARTVRKVTLAPGVFIDYEHGRICLHRPRRVKCF